MFALCDVNSFYASCETVFRPDLQGRPVAKGAPYFKQKVVFRRHNIVAFSSNQALYADMSARVSITLALRVAQRQCKPEAPDGRWVTDMTYVRPSPGLAVPCRRR